MAGDGAERAAGRGAEGHDDRFLGLRVGVREDQEGQFFRDLAGGKGQGGICQGIVGPGGGSAGHGIVHRDGCRRRSVQRGDEEGFGAVRFRPGGIGDEEADAGNRIGGVVIVDGESMLVPAPGKPGSIHIPQLQDGGLGTFDDPVIPYLDADHLREAPGREGHDAA